MAHVQAPPPTPAAPQNLKGGSKSASRATSPSKKLSGVVKSPRRRQAAVIAPQRGGLRQLATLPKNRVHPSSQSSTAGRVKDLFVEVSARSHQHSATCFRPPVFAN